MREAARVAALGDELDDVELDVVLDVRHPLGHAGCDAQELFEILSDGATSVETLETGKGVKACFDDGACVSYRWETGTPGSPAVEVRRCPAGNFKDQKAHLESW